MHCKVPAVTKFNCFMLSAVQWSNYSKVGGGMLHFFPSPHFPFRPQSSPPLFPSLPPIPLRSRQALFQLVVLGEHCNLPQRGRGRSPSRNSIILVPLVATILMIFPQMVTERHYEVVER